MIQVTPHMGILVAIEPVDFRRGMDGMARVCRETLEADPFAGTAFVFRCRRGTATKLLIYDGQGFWLCHKRLSAGKSRRRLSATTKATTVQAHELQVLLFAGDPAATRAAPVWRSVTPPA